MTTNSAKPDGVFFRGYAVLGTNHLPYHRGGRIAYWDGWYSDLDTAEGVALYVAEIYPWMTFTVVHAGDAEPIQATRAMAADWLKVLALDDPDRPRADASCA